MFFGKRRSHDAEEAQDVGSIDEEIVESARTRYGRFTIVPRAKQLVNGNWIARITLEEDLTIGSRQYDYAGPMSEFTSRDEAVQGGIEYAKRRLGDLT
jgi:hypothetical protein